MPAPLPDPPTVLRAIDVYLKYAYDAEPPVTVRSQLKVLNAWGGDFYAAPSFTRDGHKPPTRYTLRLGNRVYPHMKLVIEAAPDDSRYLFRVDTHDRHVCPPEPSAEYDPFCQLMSQNQRMAEQIEAAWEEQKLPTFKGYLREDLQRRNAAIRQ